MPQFFQKSFLPVADNKLKTVSKNIKYLNNPVEEGAKNYKPS